MNRSISKLFDEYQELTSQARNPSEYLVLKHDQNEVPNLPVDPNLLFFNDKQMRASNVSVYTTLTEFSCFTLFAVMQVIESHSVENRTIQLFYRMEKEEQGIKTNKKKSIKSKTNEESSTIESLENKCEFVIKEIKHAISVIIYRDVKDRLKSAQIELVKIKNKLSSIEYPTDISQVAYGLDEEDRAFIAENYLKNSTLRIRPSSRNNGPGTRIINIRADLDQSTLLQIEDYLTKLGSEWNINPFYIEEKTGKAFSVISIYVFKIANLSESLKISENYFSSFFEVLEKSYKMNPYHNAIHAADVFASLFYFYINTELRQFSSQFDVTCLLISALGHDVGHPGVTNRFLIASRDKIAIQYNDISVLENMHCSIIFSLLANENFDILAEISNEDWANCRSLIIGMILDTDLSKHFEICVKFKAKASMGAGFDLGKLDDKMLVYSMALKCSDIGHSAKCKELHLRWTGLVLEEFFMQGDTEKKLKIPVSMYCDRNNTDVPKSQAGFIKNICIPLYENWCFYLKSSHIDLCLKQLRDNFEYWDENYKSKRLTNVQKAE